MSKRTKDALERILATAAEAGIGAGVAYAANNPTYGALATVVAAALKTWLAKYIGEPDSASVAPGV